MTTSTAKAAARAVADLSGGTIIAVVEIAAPPERVFRALTDPKEILQWWGSEDSYRTTEWVADLRVGGRFRAGGEQAGGKRYALEGEFLEINPPHKLVHTWQPDWDAGQTTTVTYRLDAIEGGTRVTLRHEGFAGRPDACAGHTAGWERVLGWLDAHAAPRAASAADSAARYFLWRLLPPRPTFPADMSEAEARIMQEHALYWRGMLEQGIAVVFGPVLDPKGAWGVGVVRVKDEAQLHELASEDPVMRAGIGFSYEALPMPRAVHRG